MHHRGLLLVAMALVLPTVASVALAEPCNPAPVGRCGAFQRENVIFCYDTQTYARYHTFVSGTDTNAVIVGTAALPPLPMLLPTVGDVDLDAKYHDANVLYLRLAPAQAFAADPYNADLPTKSVWQEANSVPGLQLKDVTCATFTWYAECNSWMGPYQESIVHPDTMVA